MFNYLADITVRKYAKISSIPLKQALEDLKNAGFFSSADDMVTKEMRKTLSKCYRSRSNERKIKAEEREKREKKRRDKLAKKRAELGLSKIEFIKLAAFSGFTGKKLEEFAKTGLTKAEYAKLAALRTLTEIREATAQERQRLENQSNRPRYFLFGAQTQNESKLSLSVSYKYAPERAIKDAKYESESNNEKIFKIGDIFVKGSMSPAPQGVKVTIPYCNLSEFQIDISEFKAIMNFGLYYVMDSRGFADNLVYFLRNSDQDKNLILDVLEKITLPSNINAKTFNFFDLNPSQNAAIAKAIRQKVTFIWGPPGTGKTTTMGALAATLVMNGYRVLLAAPSNNALDQLLFTSYSSLCLSEQKYSIARLGTVIDEKCFGFTKEAFKNGKFLAKRAGNGFHWGEHIINSSLVAANFAQLASSYYDFIGEFDYVLADEVSMSSTPQLMVAACYSKNSIVFGGDPRQLPPPFPEDAEEPNEWFRANIFQKASIIDYFDQRVSFLDTQYRMQPEIGELVSQIFYDGQIKPGIDGSKESSKLVSKIFFINSSGIVNTKLAGFKYIDDQIRHNETHAILSVKAIVIGLENGFLSSEIGVIAPYNAQIAIIKDILYKTVKEGIITSTQADDIKVSTIHSFQGQEKRMIIIDFTDSNIQPTPLTAKVNLINVALSRAKDQLFIIGNKDYLLSETYFNASEIKAFKQILMYSTIISEYTLDQLMNP